MPVHAYDDMETRGAGCWFLFDGQGAVADKTDLLVGVAAGD